MIPSTRALAAVQAIVCALLVVTIAVIAPSAHAQEGSSTIQGRVTDAESGAPIADASVVLVGPSPNAVPVRRTTDADGVYSFSELVEGTYEVRFEKQGFTSADKSVAVPRGQVNRTDTALAEVRAEPATLEEPAAAAAGGATPDAPPGVEEFLVLAPPGGEILAASRMDADELLNTLSAEEFSRFAASDVGDALKRLPGVNVVGGQFAVIRGLDDRYSSTLFNGAPIPSPDPDRQSVQLDFFPSEIVSNLAVSKTFVPELPGNSAGGSISIFTENGSEEGWELKLSSGGGFNDRAVQRFIRLDHGSAIGVEENASYVAEDEFSGSLRGLGSVFERQVRFTGIFNQELDFQTAEGVFETLEPVLPVTSSRGRPPVTTISRSGDLSLGELTATSGNFDLTESERSEQATGYVGLGIDLDEAGNHRIDGTFFYTDRQTESVQLRENGYLPGIDYSTCARAQQNDEDVANCLVGDIGNSAWIASTRGAGDGLSKGFSWSDSFQDSLSFDIDRDLSLFQLNGDHTVEQIEGLHFSWAVNRAKATQTEAVERLRFAYPSNPNDPLPGTAPGTIPVNTRIFPGGAFYTTQQIFDNSNDIEEVSKFGRFDAEYEFDPVDFLTMRVNSGFWYETAERDVASRFLESPSVDSSSQFSINEARTARELGELVDEMLDTNPDGLFSGTRSVTSAAEREVTAWNFGGKLTFWELVDLLGGYRVETIQIKSENDPFTGENDPFDGAPKIFPSAYLLFDRRDNPNRPFEQPTQTPETPFNDQIVNLALPVNPATGFVDQLTREDFDAVINGEIDDREWLPSAGFNIRPLEGLSIRGAYSRTIARPSFREIGYYVSVDSGTDDLIVGNPQLQLSEVKSWDARVEYFWGGFGDNVAVSLFYKEIADPIESIILRDASNFGGGGDALFRTFFNNENQATLQGFEVEARKNLGLFGFEFGEYLSIGGNFTYIDASVKRSAAELARAAPFFAVKPGDPERFDEYEEERRLYNQPEWTANLDFNFDQPDWGTDFTVSVFAISSVLDAAGSASLNLNNEPFAFTLDRYIDSFYQLDAVFKQTIPLYRLPGTLTFKATGKNLTDSKRELIYDQEQTRGKIAERSYRVGRDFAFTLTYTYEF